MTDKHVFVCVRISQDSFPSVKQTDCFTETVSQTRLLGKLTLSSLFIYLFAIMPLLNCTIIFEAEIKSQTFHRNVVKEVCEHFANRFNTL